MNYSFKWINFHEVKDTGKTKVWDIKTKHGEILGFIGWHGPFRKYAFFPADSTIYDASCLNDIMSFINERMGERS